MEKTIKAIVIDSTAKTVNIKNIESSLNSFYKILNCDLISIVDLGGGYDLIVDDMGKLKEQTTGFVFRDHGLEIAGNGIIVCHDDEGDTTSVKGLSPELINYMINFVDLTDNPFEARIEIRSFDF